MKRWHQDSRRIQYCLMKLFISTLPLVPQFLGSYINIIEAPLETTRYITAVLLIIDLCTFRFLFLEDLCSRKGQASIVKSSSWSFPNAGLYVLGSIVAFFFGVVLFGAPLLDSWLETLHLAMLLSVVAFTPFCLIYAQPVEECLKFIQTFETDMNVDKACLLPGLIAVVGAWCGAVVIPLDWDRPWQAWPIPCCYGALLGYAIGNAGWLLAIWWKSWNRPGSFASKTERLID